MAHPRPLVPPVKLAAFALSAAAGAVALLGLRCAPFETTEDTRDAAAGAEDGGRGVDAPPTHDGEGEPVGAQLARTTMGGWEHVSITLTTLAATVRIGGVVASLNSPNVPLASPLQLAVGLLATGPLAKLTARYDNVRLTVQQ